MKMRVVTLTLIFMLVSLAHCFVAPPSLSEDLDKSKKDSDNEEAKPDIRSLHISSDISFRFATTHVTSVIANPSAAALEATFYVTLPKSAFMTNFSMNIDGAVIVGDVKEKEEAKQQYEQAVSKGQSAGHIAATTRESNNFKVSVNVAAEKKVTFNLEYQEMLQRRLGHYEHIINIDPGQIVNDLLVEVNINESRPLTKLRVPPIRKETEYHDPEKMNSDAVVTQNGKNSASIVYKPSRELQKLQSGKGINGQFVVEYDVQRALDGGEVQVVNGYFIHALAPAGLPPLPKNILFILDVSGSMSGKKIQQVKDAMNTVLDDLRQEDTFNLMTFDNRFTFWKEKLQKVEDGTISSAKAFVHKMAAVGATNIDGALSRGINFFEHQEASEKEKPSIIIFLTDGDPTVGETSTKKIQENVRKLNMDKYTLFSLGFGENLNFNFLKQLSLQNGGLARKIYEASDANLQLKNFYKEVSIPLLANVAIKYQVHGGEISDMTKNEYNIFYSGTEMMIAGRMRQHQQMPTCIIRPCMYGESILGNITICPPGPWPPVWPSPRPTPTRKYTPDTGLAGGVERMWAYLTIQELLDKKLRATNESEQEELKQEALKLSLMYNFVTPLTSMVVTLPDKPNATLGDFGDSKNTADHDSSVGYMYPAGLPAHPGPPIYNRQAGVPIYHSYLPGAPGQPGYALKGSLGTGSRPRGLPGPSYIRRVTATHAPTMPTTPATTAAPVLGEPSVIVRMRRGVLCMSWPQMSRSGHVLIKDRGFEIRATHGTRGTIESIMIKNPTGYALVTPSQMIINSQLTPWGQSYTGNNATITGNTVVFNLRSGFKVAVHKVSSSDLAFDWMDKSGVSHAATGILRYTHSWVLRANQLLTPTLSGVKRFATSSKTVASTSCKAPEKDIFDITMTSRRA